MKKIFETLSYQIILSIVGTMLIGAVALLCHDEIRGIYWIIAMLLAVGYSFFHIKGDKRIPLILCTNTFFLLITFSTFYLNHYFYDTSWDGQTYHQEAVISLKEGWNPIYDAPLDEAIIENIWVNHYAKGNWYYAASIYDLFHDLDIGKSYNLLFMIALFTLTCSYLLQKVKWYGVLLGALAITLNPIVVSQMLTHYNDGEIGLLMSLMVVLLLRYRETKQRHTYRFVGLLLVVLASVKFTALAYGMLVAFAPFLYAWYLYFFVEKKRNLKTCIVETLRMNELKVFVLALFLGVCVIGAASYVQNTIDHGHPFYPLSGEGKIDIMWYNTPKSIEDKPLYTQFYLSLFGEMTNNRTAENVALKFPLSVTENEQPYLGYVDLRIGGFGPFFGFIVAFTILLVATWRSVIFRKENAPELILMLVLLLSILINPELWWARYIPQLWLLPLLTLWIMAKEKTKTKQVAIWVLSLLMLFNSGIMLKASVEKNMDDTAIRNEQLTMLKKYSKEHEITIQYDTQRSNRVLFSALSNVQKEEIGVTDYCSKGIKIQGTTTKVCLPNGNDYAELREANEAIIEKYTEKTK